MAVTQEIPKSEWIPFLDGFSRGHEGWQVTVEVESPEIGAQVQSQDVPLQGISADVRDAGTQDISIMVGAQHNPPLTHIVPRPEHVWVKRSDGGADEALQIEAGDGSKTILRFRAAMRPENIDR